MSTIVDFLENAFGCSSKELKEMVRSSPDVLLRKQSEVIGLMGDVWAGPALEDQRKVEQPGEIWPVLPRNAPDIIALVRTLDPSETRFGTSTRAAENSRRDIQSLLLYAHGVHLPNPLALPENSEEDSKGFLRAVSQICLLAPLISAGVVRVFEPGDPPRLDLSAGAEKALDELASHIGLALMSYEGNRQMNQGLLREAADILVARGIEHLVDLAGRDSAVEGSILLPTAYDAPTVAALLGVLQGKVGLDDVQPADAHQVRLNQLTQLDLPGLSRLDLEEMVSIRDDESFGVFRTDMSTALVDADADVREGRLEVARRIVGEHMDAGVARLNARTRRGVLADATIGDAVGWGLGAAVATSIAGLRGLVAGLLGKGAAEVVRSWPSPGERSLRAHYAALGTSSLQIYQAESIDFLAFETDQLWGPSLGRPRQEASRQAIVKSLLDDLPS